VASDKETFTSQFVTSQFSHLSNMINKLKDDNDPFGDRRAKLSRALGHLALSFAELVTLPPEREPSFKTAADRAKYGLDEPAASPAGAAPATPPTAEAPKKRRGRKPKAAEPESVATTGNEGSAGTSIDTLGLGTRAYNCLKKKKVLTVEKLVTFDEATLLKIPRFGKTCLEDVQKRLKKAGHALGHKNGSAEEATKGAEEPELATAGARGSKSLPW